MLKLDKTSIGEHTLNFKTFILMIAVLTMTIVSTAQETETETFTSSFLGNLIVEYPSDWQAYDDENEFVTAVAKGEVSISNTLDEGEAALLFLTPQGLDFAGLPSTDANSALQALIGEMPPETVESELISEYGNGTQFEFGMGNDMSFIIGAFDRDGIPLIAILGMNNAPEADVEILFNVMKTVRYTQGAFDNVNIALSQRVVDPTYGYTYFVPANWNQYDDFGFEIIDTFDTGTVFLLNADTLEEDEDFDEINLETMVQAELELIAPDVTDDVEVIIEDIDEINGYPAREVLMFLDEDEATEETPPFEYGFILVDFLNDQVLLVAMYTPPEIGTTSIYDYLPTLRAIAESFYYGPFETFDSELDHAGLTLPYPSDFLVDVSDENQIILSKDDITMTINSPQKNIELYADVAEGDMSDFATFIASENGFGELDVQVIPIGHPNLTRLFTTPLGETDTFTAIFIESDAGVITLIATYPDAVFEDLIPTIEGIASQIRLSAEDTE